VKTHNFLPHFGHLSMHTSGSPLCQVGPCARILTLGSCACVLKDPQSFCSGGADFSMSEQYFKAPRMLGIQYSNHSRPRNPEKYAEPQPKLPISAKHCHSHQVELTSECLSSLFGSKIAWNSIKYPSLASKS